MTETDGPAAGAAGARSDMSDASLDAPDAAARDVRCEAIDADVATYWDRQYRAGGELWGETPSELAVAAVERLRQLGPDAAGLTLLDLGCGYGRDDIVLWRALGLAIVGVDGAQRAVEMARAALPAGARIDYRCVDLTELGARAAGTRFDVVYSSNVYQLLGPPARAAFRAAVGDLLAPGGLFFMSTLSAVDPQHAGQGQPVPGEPDSFVERRYLHLCRREELTSDFDFLALERLEELACVEERPGGEPHHHVSWLLVGRAP